MSSNNHDKSYYHGIVYRKTLGSYLVRNEHGEIPCVLSSMLHKNLEGWYEISQSTNIRRQVKEVHKIKTVDPVSIGDRVTYFEAGDGTGMITEVLPRENALSRHETVGSKRVHTDKRLEQVIVANVDQAVPVFSAAQPAPKWHLLDRYLVSAELSDIPSLIVITKADLVDEEDEVFDAIEDYQRIGYPVLLTSTVDETGLDDLRERLAGQISVFVGKSGVGKTSLLNAIQPELGLRVNEINKTIDKGKHTTTHLEMFPLDFGGAVVDTPGMKQFGIWERGVDMAYYFPEMRPYIGTCRFGVDCRHVHEPDCAIKEALAAGEISEGRYESFRRLS